MRNESRRSSARLSGLRRLPRVDDGPEDAAAEPETVDAKTVVAFTVCRSLPHLECFGPVATSVVGSSADGLFSGVRRRPPTASSWTVAVRTALLSNGERWMMSTIGTASTTSDDAADDSTSYIVPDVMFYKFTSSSHMVAAKIITFGQVKVHV